MHKLKINKQINLISNEFNLIVRAFDEAISDIIIKFTRFEEYF